MDYITYMEKLGLCFFDTDKQNIFLSNIRNYICDIAKIDFPYTAESVYASKLGVETFSLVTPLGQRLYPGFNRTWNYIRSFEHFEEKLAAIVVLCNFLNELKIPAAQNFKRKICSSLESAHILYQVYDDEDGIFIFPKGNELLDKGEVEEPLSLLDSFPTSKKAFIKALKMYHDANSETASIVADQFRKALETFFKEFFCSDKSLENLKSEYGSFLKSHHIPSELSNNFESLLQSYTNFINNFAKHKDATSESVLEYIMYQTGNIIRLLITLKQNDEKDTKD